MGCCLAVQTRRQTTASNFSVPPSKQGDFVKQIRKRLTYANVMSSLAVFLTLGGATAFAASQLGKNSVGAKQLKANAVTAKKIKNNAVTTAKLKNGAVTGSKIANGSLTGAQVNASTLGTVPNSVTTDEVRSSKGTLSPGQTAVAVDYAGVKLIVKCEPYEGTKITARTYIESSADGTTFISWEDAGKSIGPATPEDKREVTDPNWADSAGEIGYEAGAPVDFTTAAGASLSGIVGLASEKDSNTCWYWFHGTVIS